MIIGVIGLGLIGGSAARELSYIGHIVYGYDSDNGVIAKAIEDKTIAGTLCRDNTQEIDILLVCTYAGGVIDAIGSRVKLLKPDCIVMDMAGIKGEIVAEMTRLSQEYPKLNFVGGHPMAGREVSGYLASKQGLFLGARMLLVPVKADDRAMQLLNKLFQDMGIAKVCITTASEHDKNIAYTSQLAHVLSNAYIKSPRAQYYLDFGAGSFKDLTRVAGMNVPMWTQLMLDNADNLIEELDIYLDNLMVIKKALQDRDEMLLSQELAKGDTIKRQLNIKELKL